MGKIVGKYLVVTVGSNAYTALRSSTFEMAADMIDVTTADSTGGWKEYLAGEKGGTISIEGLYDTSATEGFEEAADDLISGAVATFKYGETESGTTYWTGSGLISSVSITGDKNDGASYSLTIQLTGAVTKATNP
jgi:TP901-1 family phage major tail protein